MANYSFTVGSTYDPFKFEEIAQPFMLYKQEYDKHNDEMSKLMEEASVWDGMVNEQDDPYTFARLNTFKKGLKGYSDDMAINGLNPSYRQALMNTKADFAKRIKPIEAAFTKRAALQEEQRKAMGANKGLRYERMANEMSLDTFVTNPNADYGNSVDLNQIKDEVWAIADKASKLARNGRIPAKVLQELGITGYGAMIEAHGATVEMIYDLLLKGIENSQFSPAIQSILDKYGVGAISDNGQEISKGWGNDKLKHEVYGALKQGVYGWLGDEKITPLQQQQPKESSGGGGSFTDQYHIPLNTLKATFLNYDEQQEAQHEATYQKFNIDGANNTFFNHFGKKNFQDIYSPGMATSHTYTDNLGFQHEIPAGTGAHGNPEHVKYAKIQTTDGTTIHYTGGNGGFFLPKSDIIKQGKTEKDKELISEWYDEVLSKQFQDVGIDITKVTNPKTGSTIMNDFKKAQQEAYTNWKDPKGWEMDMAPIAWDKKAVENILQNIVFVTSATADSDKKAGIGLLKGIKDGALQRDDTYTFDKDFIKRNDDGSIKLQVGVNPMINLNGKNPCIVLKSELGDKSLVIPISKLGTGVEEVYNKMLGNLQTVEKNKQQGYEFLMNEVQEGRMTQLQATVAYQGLLKECAQDLAIYYSNMQKACNNLVNTAMKKAEINTTGDNNGK